MARSSIGVISNKIFHICFVMLAVGGCSAQRLLESPSPPPAPAPVVEAPAPVVPPAPMPPPPQPVETTSTSPGPGPVQASGPLSGAVLFEKGSAELTLEARKWLRLFADDLNSIHAEKLRVLGYADSGGKSASSQELSRQRAIAVKNYLLDQNVKVNQIQVIGMGKWSGPVPAERLDPLAENRVVIDVVDARGQVDQIWKPENLVPVLFATDRRYDERTDLDYRYGETFSTNSDVSRLSRGVALVRIPPERLRGTIKMSGYIMASVYSGRDEGKRRREWMPHVNYNPNTMFSFDRIDRLDADAFKARLMQSMQASQTKTAILYVHGYNNSFREAAFRAAQIAYDLAMPDFDVVPLMFSWPSRPHGLVGVTYPEAQRRTERAADDLVSFLDEIAASTDIRTVHIIAHSMGGQVLVQAMQKMAKRDHMDVAAVLPSDKFRQIVFAAADVTPRFFNEVITPAVTRQHTVTSYITSKDNVLRISKVPNWRTQERRVGNSFNAASLVGCIDTVDVGDFATGSLAHSAWAESPRIIDDLRLLLRFEAEPKVRGLRARPLTRSTIWEVTDSVPVVDATTLAKAAECEK